MSCKRDTNEERSHIIFYTPTYTATLYRHIIITLCYTQVFVR